MKKRTLGKKSVSAQLEKSKCYGDFTLHARDMRRRALNVPFDENVSVVAVPRLDVPLAIMSPFDFATAVATSLSVVACENHAVSP